MKNKKRKKIYRRCLLCALIFTCLTLAGVGFLYYYEKIPGNIKLKMGEDQVLNIGLPLEGEIIRIQENTSGDSAAVPANGQGESNIPADSIYIDLSSPVTMRADTLSSYRMTLKLFGVIPFKQVHIDVIENMTLTPVGLPVGIYMKTDGVLVIGVGDFISVNGSSVSPSRYLLKTGDYILSLNGEAVTEKADFIKMVEKCGGQPVVLSVRRGGEIFDIEVQPYQNQSGEYKLGIWVRDNAQGVGTMTFVDGEGNFGALGHGINDVDTGMIMELSSGTLYKTDIVAIKKGVRGEPGEMTGMIEYNDNNIFGIITDNTERGIFGTCNDKMLACISAEPLPIGLKQEVEIGAAEILCMVDGELKYYDILIKECHFENNNINRGIVLQVTDPELIALTGGIIQGMSGAPIIQNGRLIGAVTHVLINDSTSGYGIFIEEMIAH